MRIQSEDARTRSPVGFRLWLTRWLLAPRTTWLARRLLKRPGSELDARTAWVTARVTLHPEERPYLEQHR